MLIKLNYYYSKLWIAVTGKDKYAYREKSIVHHILTKIIYKTIKH